MPKQTLMCLFTKLNYNYLYLKKCYVRARPLSTTEGSLHAFLHNLMFVACKFVLKSTNFMYHVVLASLMTCCIEFFVLYGL